MRCFAILAAVFIGGCSMDSGNPYDTSGLQSGLEERDASLAEYQLKEQAERGKAHQNDEKSLVHDLSSWRASVLENAPRETLQRMKEASTARVTDLERQEKELAAMPAPLSSDPLVSLRRDLAVERQKLKEINGRLDR
jgi:hypothetical protein